jgi:hypothetical protein
VNWLYREDGYIYVQVVECGLVVGHFGDCAVVIGQEGSRKAKRMDQHMMR